MESSLFGKKPKTSKQAFWEPLKKVVSFAVSLIITIGMAFVELIELIGDFIMEILMEWLPILEFILWLIIRALLLIIIWILFAMITIFFILTILTLFIITLPLALIFGGNINYKINKLKTDIIGNPSEIGFNIDLEFNSFLDFWVPFIEFYFIINGTTLFNVALKFWLPEIQLNFDDGGDIGMSNLKGNNTEKASINSSRLRSSNSPQDWANEWDALLSGLDDGFGSWASLILIFMAVNLIEDVKIRTILHLGTFTLSMIFAIIGYSLNQYSSEEALLYFIGAAVSSFITSIAFLYYLNKGDKLYVGDPKSVFLEEMVELEKIGEEVGGELVVDFLELFIDTLNIFPEECQLAGDFAQVISTGLLFLPKAFVDWRESMKVIPYWSKVVKKEEISGYIFITPILVSIALIIIGLVAYSQLNEN